jgi:hypothetical protein
LPWAHPVHSGGRRDAPGLPSRSPFTFRERLAGQHETLAQLEVALRLEQQGFADLIAGSNVTEDEIFRLAETSWYLTADEALSRKLVAGLL